MVKDEAPAVQPRGPKKQKQKQPVTPRKPYKVYKSADGIEIFVGRGARDNDELSISSARECPREWWMHAAGCPGSHVVIKCDDDEPPRPTVLDAAALAAKYSKAAGNRVSVSLTRCRNVSKPRGAKPGLVNINGDVATIKLDMKSEADRLGRLEATLAGGAEPGE
mmetsp:Transcript_38294/g.104275  ORF Transcript_38294/g.104275 Transcript_38294/m.104275 type:complete len:165 (+) Transcript_38294:129-623(+)